VFRSVKNDLKGKAAFAGLGLMLAFFSWGDNMRFGELNVDFTNLHDEDGRVIAQVRSVREAVHLEQKAITEFLAPSAATHQVWYVDSRRGSADNDGTSWDRALSDLQAAIDRAAAAGGGEVWVAAGVYRLGPPQQTAGASAGVMLRVPGNVRVFGGFTGKTSLFPELHRRERNWSAHPTVLLTSVQRGPETVEGLVLLEDGAVLDGLVVTSANASQSGGLISVNPSQRHQKPSIIGNSRFLLFDRRRPLPLTSAGGTTLVHNSRFAPGNEAWPQLNARVTVTAHCIVIPHPTLTK
jgi:polygalacturonase